MSNLEDMMKKDGWELGSHINWGVEYFSFRKDGFEIDEVNINEIFLEKETKHFKPWVPCIKQKGENKMIEISDLQDLRICKKCKHVYMPEFKPDCDYARTPYPVNKDFCINCEELEVEE